MLVLLDVLTAIILIVAVVSAARKGFVKTAIDFFGTIVAFVVALVFSKTTAAWLQAKYVGPFFEKIVSQGLENFMTSAVTDSEEFAVQFTKLFETAPDALQKLLEKFSVDASEVVNAFTSAPDTVLAKEAAITAIYQPIAAAVSLALGFVILFVGAMLVIKLGTFVVDSVANLPVLKQVNGMLGIGLGALKGILFVFVLTALVSFLAPVIQNYTGQAINGETIDTTLLFKYFYAISPLKNLLL